MGQKKFYQSRYFPPKRVRTTIPYNVTNKRDFLIVDNRRRQRVNFTNILREAFILTDHKIAKGKVKSSVILRFWDQQAWKLRVNMLVKSSPRRLKGARPPSFDTLFSTSGVNFTNVLCSNFSYKIFGAKTSNTKHNFVIFGTKILYKKRARLMLMKLTPGVNFTNPFSKSANAVTKGVKHNQLH